MLQWMRKHVLRRITALLLLLLLLGYLTSLPLSVEYATFSSPRLPEGWSGGRIALLTDLHGQQFGENNRSLTEALRQAAPDLIAIGGDLTDDSHAPEVVAPLLEQLVQIAPTYYVSGNHEWAAGHMPALRQLFEQLGIHDLGNRFTLLERGGDSIVLAGIEDPNGYADQESPAEVAADLYAQQGDPFWILLAHRNNQYDTYGTLGADLILTGHAHGGLIRLPFTDGLIGTGGEFFPRWTDGFYSDYPSPMFVSRGLGNSVPIPRLFNPPQLAILTLQRTEES